MKIKYKVLAHYRKKQLHKLKVYRGEANLNVGPFSAVNPTYCSLLLDRADWHTGFRPNQAARRLNIIFPPKGL